MTTRGNEGPRMHRITVEGGPSFEMGPQEDCLLRGALRAGLPFPYECSVGGCGTCRFDLVDGGMHTLWAEAPGLSARERQRGRRLACQSVPQGDCTIRLRLGDGPAAPVAARRHIAELVARRRITADLAEFTLRLPQPAAFLPGQYALFHLPGVTGARAYSMSNASGAGGEWRFIVRRVPGGAGSTTLFDDLAPGRRIEIDGPYGHAYLRDGERDLVCVAGGSGLGPMLSVARGLQESPGTRRLHFFLGLRSQADLGACDELAGVRGPRLTLHTVLSAPRPDLPWGGATGFVHAAVESFLDAQAPDHDFYLAGPPPMIEAMQDLLVIRRRVPLERIRFDRFV